MRNEKVLEFLTFTHSSKIGVGEHAESVYRLTISRQVADALKLKGVVCYKNVKPTKKRPKINRAASTRPISFRTYSERTRDC